MRVIPLAPPPSFPRRRETRACPGLEPRVRVEVSPLPRWERARVRVNTSQQITCKSLDTYLISVLSSTLYTLWSQIDGSGHLSSRKTVRGIRTNTLTASTDTFKVTESIGDRAGSYNFSPALIASRSRRKQRPLYSAHPMGITESPFFDRAGSEGCIKGWSPRMLQAWHHKPIDSTRVETGQPSFRGRVRCQSHLVAWERRRREPGSNSVSDTASLTRCEGQVLRLGGVRRVRKIFAGCPAIRPIWDQSPERLSLRFETVGNRLYPSHGQNSLCRSAAEAKIQDRSRTKTGLNTAPGFHRVYNNIPSPSMGEG